MASNSQHHQSLHKSLEEEFSRTTPQAIPLSLLCLHLLLYSHRINSRQGEKHQPYYRLDKLQDQICQGVEPGGGKEYDFGDAEYGADSADK